MQMLSELSCQKCGHTQIEKMQQTIANGSMNAESARHF